LEELGGVRNAFTLYLVIFLYAIETSSVKIPLLCSTIQLKAKRAIVCDVSYSDADFWNGATWGGLGG
jgi:hypothetical protein